MGWWYRIFRGEVDLGRPEGRIVGEGPTNKTVVELPYNEYHRGREGPSGA